MANKKNPLNLQNAAINLCSRHKDQSNRHFFSPNSNSSVIKLIGWVVCEHFHLLRGGGDVTMTVMRMILRAIRTKKFPLNCQILFLSKSCYTNWNLCSAKFSFLWLFGALKKLLRFALSSLKSIFLLWNNFMVPLLSELSIPSAYKHYISPSSSSSSLFVA